MSPVMGTRRNPGLRYDDIVSSAETPAPPKKNLRVFVKSVCEEAGRKSGLLLFYRASMEGREDAPECRG